MEVVVVVKAEAGIANNIANNKKEIEVIELLSSSDDE